MNAAERERTGVESREERFLSDMVGLQEKLSNLQRLVQAEIVKANEYLGSDSEPEAERVPRRGHASFSGVSKSAPKAKLSCGILATR